MKDCEQTPILCNTTCYLTQKMPEGICISPVDSLSIWDNENDLAVWEIAKEESRQSAERMMELTTFSDWDRKDHINIGSFYKYYIDYLEKYYSISKKTITI